MICYRVTTIITAWKIPVFYRIHIMNMSAMI